MSIRKTELTNRNGKSLYGTPKKYQLFLSPNFEKIDLNEIEFSFEASVIIPVKIELKPLKMLLNPGIETKTKFPFNLIIIDNYSNDGNNSPNKRYAQQNKQIIHIIPSRTDLGIGSCWNEGIHHPNVENLPFSLIVTTSTKRKIPCKKRQCFYEQQWA